MGRKLAKALTLPWDEAWSAFVAHRKVESVSPHTLAAYTVAQTQLRARLPQGATPADVDRDDIAAYLGDLLAAGKPSTAATRYWGLRAFFGWLVDEGEVDRSPLDGLKPPKVEVAPPDVISDDDVTALLAACEGRSFEDRRDTAIMRTLADTGLRVGGLCSMTLEGLDIDERMARVQEKGTMIREVHFSPRTARDLDRYLRIRRAHPSAALPNLWLGYHGAFTPSGVGQMLKIRADRAGLNPAAVHAHRFRHAYAAFLKRNGASEEDIMRLGGWRSPTMMRRYAAANAEARARETHRRLTPGDRF